MTGSRRSRAVPCSSRRRAICTFRRRSSGFVCRPLLLPDLEISGSEERKRVRSSLAAMGRCRYRAGWSAYPPPRSAWIQGSPNPFCTHACKPFFLPPPSGWDRDGDIHRLDGPSHAAARCAFLVDFEGGRALLAAHGTSQVKQPLDSRSATVSGIDHQRYDELLSHRSHPAARLVPGCVFLREPDGCEDRSNPPSKRSRPMRITA